jgi:hypothetical protein
LTFTGTGASIQHAVVPIIQDQNATQTRAGMTLILCNQISDWPRLADQPMPMIELSKA